MADESTPVRYYFADILAVTGEVFGLHPNHIAGRGRQRDRVRIRGVVALLARELTQLSYAEIGRRLSGQHHTTVMHSAQMAREFARESVEFAQLLGEVRANLTGVSGVRLTREELRRVRIAKAAAKAAEAAEAAEAAPPERQKDRNDFSAEADADDGHRFHARVAEGSNRFLATLGAAQ